MKDGQSFNWEVSVGVTFSAFMSAVTLFFTGVVISQFKAFDASIKVPILLLIVSTFSFIFSAAIYSNAGVEITNNKVEKVRKYLSYANNIFEFLGLHLLILATPLVIGAITKDNFLRLATISIALLALALYSVSDFSILHKEVRSWLRKYVLIFLLVVLAVGLYMSQHYSTTVPIYNLIGSLVLLFHILLPFYFNSRSRQYE